VSVFLPAFAATGFWETLGSVRERLRSAMMAIPLQETVVRRRVEKKRWIVPISGPVGKTQNVFPTNAKSGAPSHGEKVREDRRLATAVRRRS